MNKLLEILNEDSKELVTEEMAIKALEKLKNRGVLDYKITNNITFKMIAPELMFEKPTFH